MPHPVYRFRLVLKELRQDAGLTVMAAAEATGYRNYERWESGATRVGAQHVRSIAAAFGVIDECWLLIYAWLLDRLTPFPSKGAVDLAQANLPRVLRDLPDDVIDLGANEHLVVEPASQLDVALMCLIARYLRRQRLVLMPLRRSVLPPRQPGESVLQTAYGDVVGDAARHLARMLLGPGCAAHADTHDAEQILLANIGPMLTSPEAFEALADEVAGPFAAEARRFAEILRIQREALSAIVEAAAGGPVLADEVTSLATDMAFGHFDRLAEVMVTAARRDALPDVDPGLYAEMCAMYDRVETRWNEEARREVASGLEMLDAEGLFDALEVVADFSPHLDRASSDR